MATPTFKKDKVVPTPFFNFTIIFTKSDTKIYLKSREAKGLLVLVNIRVGFSFQNLKVILATVMAQKRSTGRLLGIGKRTDVIFLVVPVLKNSKDGTNKGIPMFNKDPKVSVNPPVFSFLKDNPEALKTIPEKPKILNEGVVFGIKGEAEKGVLDYIRSILN